MLAGSTVGWWVSVVGREVIRLLKLMQANVRVYDPFARLKTQAMGAEAYDDLLAMMDGLDVLTVHTPL